MALIRSLALLLVLFAVPALHAQAWGGSANFPNSVNGNLNIDLTINNADTADRGIGTIDKVNGVVANTPFWWKRLDNGNVEIYADEAMTNKLGTLKNLPKNQPVVVAPANSGNGELNDQTPPSAGTYRRSS